MGVQHDAGDDAEGADPFQALAGRARAGDGAALDEAVGSLLERARSSIELARQVQDRRSRLVDDTVAHVTGSDQVDAVVAEMLAGARHEVIVCWPGSLDGDDQVDVLLRRQLDLIGRGVRCHRVHTPEVRRCPRTQSFLAELQLRGARVRLAPAVPHELLLVDGRVAALPPTFDTDGSHQLVVRSPALLHAVRAMVNQLWRTASDFPSATEAGGPREDVDRRVLRCLSEGATDEVAARELGLSVRTYRRHVATILRELGASSRFQAGVLAVERGLL